MRRRFIMSDWLEKTWSPISEIRLWLRSNQNNCWSPSNSPSCNFCILFPEAVNHQRLLRWEKQLSGSPVSWLLSRYRRISVVRRQTERGRTVNGVLTMISVNKRPYVWLLDSSESSRSVSCSRSTSGRPWQSMIKLAFRWMYTQLQLEGQFKFKVKLPNARTSSDNNNCI